jgi:lipopolysaccharide/colanic/teichoic acid biosynthesis glycosyltransferase
MTREQSVGSVRDLTARLKQWMCSEPTHMAGSSGIYSIEQLRTALLREQARAERNGHQIALALLPANGHNGDARRTSRLLEVLKDRLRLTDEAGWFSPSQIGVLMPYTSCEGAWHMIEDLCALLNGDLVKADCSVYIYPYDWIDDEGGPCEHDVGETCAVEPAGAPAAQSFFSSACNGSSRSSPSAGVSNDPDAAFEQVACVYPIVAVPQSDPSAWQRAMDIALSLLALTLLAPVLLGAALLIKLVSPGPVFFKQERIGRGGRPFMLWKFRTMAPNADTSIHENHVTRLIKGTSENEEAASKPMTKLDNDPRVIPLGSILRGACIDELPQLINVLRGEMSLVGPRPPIPYEVRDYQPWQRRRLDAVPGLTGLWQVSGKNKLTFDQMVRLDIQYSRKRSVWMNTMIMLRTPRVILGEIAGVWVRWKVRAPENA